MGVAVLSLPGALDQDERWVNGVALDDLDPDHRSNLIPFLRRNADVLFALHEHRDRASFTDAEADEWITGTPLMRRLVAIEAGRPIEDRRATHERNVAYEQATGYQKIRLVTVPDDVPEGPW